jgi:YfiH family protein
MSLHPEWLVPDWPAPRNVRAFVTTRAGGTSEGEYASMNLGLHGGDEPRRVAANRAIVHAELPSQPVYLAQVHGDGVADIDAAIPELPRADAAVASKAGRVAVVLTADCMPLLLCDRAGARVAVAHAGWRGMAAGVIEQAVRALQAEPRQVMAWLGPTIGPDAFEVGPEVRDAFMATDTRAESAFRPHRPGKYMADLYALARQRLGRAGVAAIYGGGFCTYHEPGRFFSYRRVPRSGRMGAFIWKE